MSGRTKNQSCWNLKLTRYENVYLVYIEKELLNIQNRNILEHLLLERLTLLVRNAGGVFKVTNAWNSKTSNHFFDDQGSFKKLKT